jgi:four helix bundle protein
MKDEKQPFRDLKARSLDFALAAIQFYVRLPKTTEAQILGKQFLRSATSVGAHYREAQRVKSNADFISKMEGALQEAEESCYWLELLAGSDICKEHETTALHREAEELIAIFVAMVTKVKRQ